MTVIGTEETEGDPYKGRQILTEVFGYIPTSMYKAANLNLTFDDSEETAGNYNETGDFDGMIGLLQRNQSDFAVFTVPLESFQGYKFHLPVKIVSMTGEDSFFLLSPPAYNRTAILFDVEDSIMEIKPDVMVFYTIIFVLIHILITKVCKRIHNRMRIKLGFPLESEDGAEMWSLKEHDQQNKSESVAWNMVRYLLSQGSEMKFKLKTQTWLFFAFECSIGILLTLYMNHMSSDLVAYNKPRLKHWKMFWIQKSLKFHSHNMLT